MLIQDLGAAGGMRGSAAASYSLVAIVISSGTGHWAGKVSTLTGSLTAGLLSMLPLLPIALVLLWLAARRLPHETAAARRARAEAAGEPPNAATEP